MGGGGRGGYLEINTAVNANSLKLLYLGSIKRMLWYVKIK